MISTRLHGSIDYAAATLLASLAASRALSPPVRGALGTAAACHTAYSALTDYEGGLRPALTMRQHLALDVFGAAALCGAGVLRRGQPAAPRAVLAGAGMAEFAVVALSDATPARGPGQGSGALDRLLARPSAPNPATYPPLDVPKPMAEAVWTVDSVIPGVLERVVPLRMTVIRLPDGGLLLHSPTRFSLALRQELERFGRIRHLVAPNVAHWMFLKDWQDAIPDATTWAAPGLRRRAQVRRSGVRLDHDLSGRAPPEWGGAVTTIEVPGGLGFTEVALFHHPTRTLVLTDLVLNLEARKLPALLRPLARAFGSVAPDGMPQPLVRAIIKWGRPETTAAAERLLALAPERVVFAHGRPFERDATAALRRSLRWLLA